MVVKLLLWVHFMALAMGVGGGIGMSQAGPRLIATVPGQRDLWWPLTKVFSRIALAGMALLLITGPLLLWLKFDGPSGLPHWFWLKMTLVAVAVVMVGLAEWGHARLRCGDEAGGRLMMIAGPLTMLAVIGVVFSAVMTFN
jgi:putative membrane protein